MIDVLTKICNRIWRTGEWPTTWTQSLIITLPKKVNLQLCQPHQSYELGGGRVVRRCWVTFQCPGVLLIWIVVGQGPIALAVGAGGGCLDIFSLIYHFAFFTPSLWETA